MQYARSSSTPSIFHYRICNADFALVLGHSQLAQKARRLADKAHSNGIRLGCLVIDHSASSYPPLDAIGYMLHPLTAVAVVDEQASGILTRIVSKSLQLASEDGGSPWCGKSPRTILADSDSLSQPGNFDRLLRVLVTHNDWTCRKPTLREYAPPALVAPELAHAGYLA